MGRRNISEFQEYNMDPMGGRLKRKLHTRPAYRGPGIGREPREIETVYKSSLPNDIPIEA